MRYLSILFITVCLTLFATQTFASDVFSKLNSDLKRVGLEEIKKASVVQFESGNYRLDPDFRLGYGDTVNVNLWGKLEASHKLVVDRDGNILIPLVGKVGIAGLTIDEARLAVKRELDKKYTNVEVELSLSDAQDIRISVLGNAENPGLYAVSPFCKVIEGLAKAGGPNNLGSVSNIRLIRDGKDLISFNVYDFLFKADQRNNVRLKHGDTIYVPKAKGLIAIRGDVAYPGIYELGEGNKLSEVIDMAGGMLPTKFERRVYILRINPDTRTVERIKDFNIVAQKGITKEDDIAIQDQDTVIITTSLDYTPYVESLYRTVSIAGEVVSSGEYLISEGEKLSSLLKRAKGLKGAAFTEGAVFVRESVREKQKAVLGELIRMQKRIILEEEARLAEAILTQEDKEMRQKAIEYRRKALNLMASRAQEGRIIINLQAIVDGKADILLEKGDSLYVPPMPDWVLIAGSVYRPGSCAFEDGKDLQYYLNMAGGPNNMANKDDIYIIKANGRAESQNTGYGKISRGDIIVVPEAIDSEAKKLRSDI